jgi:hypothetical protein
MELTLDMSIPGRTELRERSKKRILKLLDTSDREINVTVTTDDDGAGVTVQFAVYHVENPETKRTFHANLMAVFTPPQLRALIRGLQYLAENVREGAE